MARKLKAWLVADCETDAFDGREVFPFIWGLITSDGDRRIFWDTAEFVEYIREFDGIAYAHNGGKFDWLQKGIIENLDQGEIKIINSRVASAKLGKCELRDSFLCLPSALEKFGEKMDFDYNIVHRKNAKHRKGKNKHAIEEYLMQDCVALFHAMERFIENHGQVLTQAGAALKTWEKMGGEVRRYGPQHDANFRPYYFGGRCQVFEYGAPIRGEFELYDVTSAYPFAMSDMHPCGTDYYQSVDYKNAPDASFWQVLAISQGAFPVRLDGATAFPVDKVPRQYHITGWELNVALETGTAKILAARGLIPRRLETLRPYIDKFFADKVRAEEIGDRVWREIAKIFLNSLYGKYGSNPENYFDYRIVAAGEQWDGWEPHLFAGEYDIIKRPTMRPQYFDVALAASVTGHARANLWRAICNSERPLYCDTDSLLCAKFHGETGDGLGQWKKEADVIAAYIGGKKLYALNIGKGKYKTAHKGVSAKDIDVKDIIRVCQGEIVEIARSAPSIKINGEQRFIDRALKIT